MEEEIIIDPILERNQMINGMINELDINPLSISIRYTNKTIGIIPDLIDMQSIVEYIIEKLTEQIV